MRKNKERDKKMRGKLRKEGICKDERKSGRKQRRKREMKGRTKRVESEG